MDPQPMTIREAVDALGLSRSQVYALLYAGQLAGEKTVPQQGGTARWALDPASVARAKAEREKPTPLRLGLWSRDRVAEYLGCTTSAVSNATMRGDLHRHSYQVEGRIRAYYDPDEVRRYAEQRRQTNRLGPAPDACPRCWMIAPLGDDGLCEICHRETTKGITYWYTVEANPAHRIALPGWEECWA